MLLLDEPTNHLDLRYQVETLDLVRDLADDHGTALGVVLHDLNHAARSPTTSCCCTGPGARRRRAGRRAHRGAPVRGLRAADRRHASTRETGRVRIEPGAGTAGADPAARRLLPRHPSTDTQMKNHVDPYDRSPSCSPSPRCTLAACGNDRREREGAAATRADRGRTAPASRRRGATGPVTLTDSYGRTVELDQPAERVAVLEWQQVEDVLTLCLTPVAVADAEGYSTWDTAEELPGGVADVGTRGEPNLDALFATNPDLVIVEAYTADDEIIEQLEKYGVPVLATKGADARTRWPTCSTPSS